MRSYDNEKTHSSAYSHNPVQFITKYKKLHQPNSLCEFLTYQNDNINNCQRSLVLKKTEIKETFRTSQLNLT
jgi:hypothetical protein